MKIGRYVQQPSGYKAFIPYEFPLPNIEKLGSDIITKHSKAIRLVGKLDGITELLPDKDWFLTMFIRKDASSSSQIEGTNATMADSIEGENVEPTVGIPDDVNDIFHYIKALNYGVKRLDTFPLTLRFIKELHEELMRGARSTQNPFPGEFRNSQNWIGGTNVQNAKYVPPAATEMKRSLSDLEKFIHSDSLESLPLVKAGFIHAQFETIHPFTDGNGRTGRMLVTMFIWYQRLLTVPVLYLSDYFKRYQKIYYEKINNYHEGEVSAWIDFFLDGIIDTAESAISTCADITKLRERDMMIIHQMNKVASESSMKMLVELFKMPIVGIADIAKWTGHTRQGAYKDIKRLIDAGILVPMKQGDNVYAQKWIYKDYLKLFD